MVLLRALAIIALFFFSLLMLTFIGFPIALMFDSDVVNSALDTFTSGASGIAAGTTALEIGLAAVALLAFIISIVRLIRRTQGFIAWLIGFVCLAALRFVIGVGPDLARLEPVDIWERASASFIAPGMLPANLVILGVCALVGLGIAIVDVADKRRRAALESGV